MITFDLLQFIAVAVMVCGLLVVVLQIVLRNPRWLWEIVSDVRKFASRPVDGRAVDGRAEHQDASAPISMSGEPRDPRISARTNC